MVDEILILSGPDDPHAFAVAEGIRRKGGRAVIWYTNDFPMSSFESIEYDDQMHLAVRGADQIFDAPSPAVVWNRRLSQTYDVSALHPADRTFGWGQCMDLRRSMIHLIGEGAFWVNPLAAQARAILKPVQLRVAQEVGFEMPRTLCSNDPERIRRFVRDCGGQVVFKQLALVGVWSDAEKRYAPYTTTIREEQLADDLRTAAAPAIFQELVPKAYELRVTAIGERLFGTRLDADDDYARVDWRLAILNRHYKMSDAPVPESIAGCVRDYLRRMNLVFGCFDFIVTPDARHLFLECNEAGQWLFVEDETGVPVLDAFVAMLMQRTASYKWRPSSDALRVSDLRKSVEAQMEEASQRHAKPNRTRFQEDDLAVATERT